MKIKTKILVGVIAVFLVTLPLMSVMTAQADENDSNGSLRDRQFNMQQLSRCQRWKIVHQFFKGADPVTV